MNELLTTGPTLLAQTVGETAIESEIHWNWPWPLWATVLLAIVCLLWVAGVYAREISPAGRAVRFLLAAFRLAAILLAVGMLAQPSREWFQTIKPRLLLLVDRSMSMQQEDAESPSPTEQKQSRWQKVQDLFGDNDSLVDRWQEHYRVDMLLIDNEITEKPGDENLHQVEIESESAQGTRLGDAVKYALREMPGEPAAAMVVVSDGVVTRGTSLSEAARLARMLRVPIFTVGIGSETPLPDVVVENLLVEQYVFPGDRLQVEATLRATGFEDRQARVFLRNAETGDPFAETEAALPGDDQAEVVRLALRPEEPGEIPLEVFVEPLSGETNLENNTARQVVRVRDERIRVLLAAAQPSYEYRALKSLLERDPAVRLHTRLQEADVGYEEIEETAIPAFPSSESALLEYDVLILNDLDPGLLPRAVWPALEDFVVQHGGGVVLIAGPRYLPWAFRGNRSMELLLPFDMETLNPLRNGSASANYPILPTPLGQRFASLQLGETPAASAAIWQALPRVTWLVELDQAKPGAQILAEVPDRANRNGQPLPAILQQYVGAGQVLMHATDETWRWRWRSDDRYFARYWGQAVRQLGRSRLAAGEEGVVVTTDRDRYQPGEKVTLQVRFRNSSDAPADDAGVAVRLESPTEAMREIRLHRRLGYRGVFSATLEELSPAEYQASLVKPAIGQGSTASFLIEEPPRELIQVAADYQALAQAAERSGGIFYTAATVDQLSHDLPLTSRQPVAGLPPQPLWNNHWLIALFVAVLATEWIVRRRYAML